MNNFYFSSEKEEINFWVSFGYHQDDMLYSSECQDGHATNQGNE